MVYFPKNIMDLIYSFDPLHRINYKPSLEFFKLFKIVDENKEVTLQMNYKEKNTNIFISRCIDTNKDLFFWLKTNPNNIGIFK